MDRLSDRRPVRNMELSSARSESLPAYGQSRVRVDKLTCHCVPPTVSGDCNNSAPADRESADPPDQSPPTVRTRHGFLSCTLPLDDVDFRRIMLIGGQASIRCPETRLRHPSSDFAREDRRTRSASPNQRATLLIFSVGVGSCPLPANSNPSRHDRD